MEPNPTNDEQNLGLESEANQLMPQTTETADLSDDAKLSNYFGRVLSDGQMTEPPPQAEEQPVENTDAIGEESDTNSITGETEVEESRPEQEMPKGVTKRIAKLTAQRKEAEEKAKQLESELESIKREQATSKKPISKNPFGDLDSEEKIQAEYDRQKEIRLFCERYPDGYYEDGKEPIEKDQIAKAKVNALRAIEDLLPQQYNYLTASKQYKAAARKEFPWLDDVSDQRAIAAKRFIEAVPAIKEFPDYEIYAAHLANGMVSYTQQKSAAKRNTPVNQRVPVMPSSSNFAPPSSQRTVDAGKASEAATRYRRSSSLDDLADVFKNKFV